MPPSPLLRVFLDANVLFPSAVRDTLLRAAELGLVQPYWSEFVLEEMRRNLVSKRGMSESKAQVLVGKMKSAFPAAMVTGFDHLIAAMKNDPKDRHVVAAALHAGATLIVTNNLADFRAEDLPLGIEARSADAFLQNQFAHASDAVVSLLRAQCRDLTSPRMSFDDFLQSLSRPLPAFVSDVRAHLQEGE